MTWGLYVRVGKDKPRRKAVISPSNRLVAHDDLSNFDALVVVLSFSTLITGIVVGIAQLARALGPLSIGP